MKKFTDGKEFVNPNELEKKCMNETKTLINEFLKQATGSESLKTKNKKALDVRLNYSIKDVRIENDHRIQKEEQERKVLFEKSVAVNSLMYC